MEVSTPPIREDFDVLDATFARPDPTTFCCLDELGLEVLGQRLRPDQEVLACRVVEPDQWCRRCGTEGSPRAVRGGMTLSAPPGRYAAKRGSRGGANERIAGRGECHVAAVGHVGSSFTVASRSPCCILWPGASQRRLLTPEGRVAER